MEASHHKQKPLLGAGGEMDCVNSQGTFATKGSYEVKDLSPEPYPSDHNDLEDHSRLKPH